jgi:hypothetical protein
MSTIAVFAVLAGGSAWAASKIGTSDLKNGAVTAKKLHKNGVTRKKIKGNAVGSAKLAAGAVRASDLGVIREVSSQVTIPPNNQDQVGANCSEGERRIGGGAASGTFGTPISGSWPNGTDGWQAHARNNSNVAVSLTVYVFCLEG